ncbi:5'-3' exonuclease [Nocardioides xinjiangensis]|uniref:5'-3' exonuclease n=1 Tax=Nocardioides xinjiangensis TaxID=2817376 RepID=UPI001FEDFA44|nr:5'-3' exonuclease [Nocardioides sp. SYSU D00778]
MTAPAGSRLMLLDTASLYFRAFFGVPDSLKAPDGTPVNAVRGLMDFISRLVGEYDPTHLACCWDDDWRPQWRVDLIPSYKAHRVVRAVPGPRPDVEEVPDPLEAQVPIILSVLEAYGIPVVGHPEMEADDVIGTLATGAGMPVDIVTGDRDLFQLVDDDAAVRVLYVARGVSRHERVDNAWVRAKYGVDAHQYAGLATLRGDASDGLPGVAGVGDKTAATLLNRFGTVEAIIEAAADPGSDMGPGPRGKIKAAADYLAVAPRVVAVRRDLDLGTPDLARPRTPADHDALVALDEKWGLGSSAVRLVQALSGAH